MRGKEQAVEMDDRIWKEVIGNGRKPPSQISLESTEGGP